MKPFFMKKHTPITGFKGFVAIIFALIAIASATAGGDHDHGEPVSAAAAQASPRMSSHSELFELTAIAEMGRLRIYLDKFDTNEPLTKARIEVEVGNTTPATKGLAIIQADGTYVFDSEVFNKPGSYPLTFTIQNAGDTDLLAGDLVIAASASGDAHDHDHGGLWVWLAAGGGALALLVLAGTAVVVIRRRQSRSIIRSIA